MPYCSKCGNQIIEGNKFCEKCGNAVEDISSTNTTPQKQTAPKKVRSKPFNVLSGLLFAGATVLLIVLFLTLLFGDLNHPVTAILPLIVSVIFWIGSLLLFKGEVVTACIVIGFCVVMIPVVRTVNDFVVERTATLAANIITTEEINVTFPSETPEITTTLSTIIATESTITTATATKKATSDTIVEQIHESPTLSSLFTAEIDGVLITFNRYTEAGPRYGYSWYTATYDFTITNNNDIPVIVVYEIIDSNNEILCVKGFVDILSGETEIGANSTINAAEWIIDPFFDVALDDDGDGYYNIRFMVDIQDGSVFNIFDNPKSAVYKIKAH